MEYLKIQKETNNIYKLHSRNLNYFPQQVRTILITWTQQETRSRKMR